MQNSRILKEAYRIDVLLLDYRGRFMKNPYKVLGVKENDSEKVIKKRYRELIRKYHPDENVDSKNADELKKKFEEVQEAYENICDIRAGKKNKYMFQSYDYNGDDSKENGSKKNNSKKNNSKKNDFKEKDFKSDDIKDKEFESTAYSANEYTKYKRANDNEKYYQNKTVAALYVKASECMRNYNFDAAISILECVEERNAMWYYLMAKAYQGMGKKQKTYDMIKIAVEADPENRMFREFFYTVSPDTMWYRRVNSSIDRDLRIIKIILLIILIIAILFMWKNLQRIM